ncbi:MAG: hypothetical protein ISR61_00090 [Desulfobacteraceae bacterium]|nr:hypothetical protein [Deltaproteobacteria bacterium]MBL6977313.1 hypothetical protein [Desulfobacteraceae bacterium]MBL7213828.1 hypothetical protein [Desulfobacteraceae bacterium]
MITVHIESGICGLETKVSACRIQRKSVRIAIRSDCEQVIALSNQLHKIDMMDVIKNPINKNLIYEKGGKCGLHSGCPVPCGVIKAAEVELGLALMKDVRIVFKNDKQVADDAT